METAENEPQSLAPNTRRLGVFSGRYTRRINAGWGPDGRRKEGKFARKLESELLRECGSLQPTFVQKLLIRRVVQIQLQLLALDEKLAEGNFTDWDRRLIGA